MIKINGNKKMKKISKKSKNTIVGGVKDSIDTNIEKLVNKCNVLDSIYKFDLNSISSKEKIDEIYTSFTTTDGTLQINKIKKILLCLRFGTEDFYNLLETDSELQDVDDKNLADTICDNFEIELNNKIGLINTKYVIPFSLIYYNNGIIYVDKYVDDTDRLPKYTLLIDDSYSTKGTEGIKIGGYLIFDDYGWGGPDLTQRGIDAFVSGYYKCIKVLNDGKPQNEQLFIQRTS